MRRPFLGLTAFAGLFAAVPTSHGQAPVIVSPFADPSYAYFGLYLPRQAALASQVRTTDIVNDQAQARVATAQNLEREALFNADTFGTDEFDTANLFGRAQSRFTRHAGTHNNTSATGSGPQQYFMRHSTPGASYYPTMRMGRYSNMNIAQTRGSAGRGRSGGGAAAYGMGNVMGSAGFR